MVKWSDFHIVLSIDIIRSSRRDTDQSQFRKEEYAVHNQ